MCCPNCSTCHTMRIDSHHHFWRYSADQYAWIDDAKQVLQRDFLPADLKAEIQAVGIDSVVSVQARQCIDETWALLEFAAANPWIRGVVGWLPLRDANLATVLDKLAQHDRLRAVRHVVQDEPDARFLMRDDFICGIAKLQAYNLVYDLLIFPHQLPAAIELVDMFPQQIFVLDHLSKPQIQAGKVDEVWLPSFRALAKRNNVFCKFSGVITEVRDPLWTIETIEPYWDIALESFGPSRLMFGSDWPVCLLRGNYAQWEAAVSELSRSLSGTEQLSFWGQTAVTAYSLCDN